MNESVNKNLPGTDEGVLRYKSRRRGLGSGG